MGKYFLHYPKGSMTKARRLRREMTGGEARLWSHLRGKKLGVHFRKQAPFGPYILDFLSIKARLAVEVDGSQHYTEDGMKKDAKRDAYLRAHGLTVLHFSAYDTVRDVGGVVQEIWDKIREHEQQ
jgi:very-short-patch-repair endonuclease